MKCTLHINKKVKAMSRGPCKPRHVVPDDRTVVERSTTDIEVDGVCYVVIDSGNIIPDKWIDIYGWFVGKRDPKVWLNCLNSTAPTTFAAENCTEEETSQLV